MDAKRFDDLARAWQSSATRRRLFAGMTSALLLSLPLARLQEEAEAGKRKKNKNTHKNHKRKKCKRGKCGCKAGAPCGTVRCGSGKAGTNCACTTTTEDTSFCLDFAKSNVDGCGAPCGSSDECDPDEVCLRHDDSDSCSCPNSPNACFSRSFICD